MLKVVEDMLNDLYKRRSTWGVAILAKTFQKHGLHIGGTKTLKRAAEVLNVSYVNLMIGGNHSISYPKESAYKMLEYILNTNKTQRTQDWLMLHPDIAEIYSKNKQDSVDRVKENRQKIKDDSLYILQTDALIKTKLSKYKFLQLCAQLDINIDANGILKSDFKKLNNYLLENYSENSRLRAVQLRMETWTQNNTGAKRGVKTSISRKQNKEANRQTLERKLGVKCYTDIEAAEFIGKNNSTLISGMKLLGLPMYKCGGTYIYDENSLIKLKNFYNNKNGIKGQIARLFEEYVRSKNIDYTCEKTFPGCYWHADSKHPLRFDYYFPEYNLVAEVQGSQHFHPSSMGADLTEEQIVENFKGLKERDQIKKDYCLKNNINFIEIITKDDFKKLDTIVYSIKDKN